ncbi:MAG: Flp family type IVb pilin [Gemmatimonadota bacterium]|nr:Flp family type IVb pilin [Gemmatimonadota bacterium]
MLSQFKALWTDESGQDLAEYALLLALIAIVVIVAVRALGPTIAQVFTDIDTELQNTGTTAG